MKDSRANHRDISHVCCSCPGAQAHGARLVGTGRLTGNRYLIGPVEGGKGRECERALFWDRLIVATIVLQNKTGAPGISGNRASDGESSKRTSDLNVDRYACRGGATAVGDPAGLRRTGRL